MLATIARDHAEVDVPLAPIVEALDFPATSDRNKAAATLSYLMQRPGAATHFAEVAREAGPTLLAMLRLAQPNNHDFAYTILKTISGQTYSDQDIAAWRAWLARQG